MKRCTFLESINIITFSRADLISSRTSRVTFIFADSDIMIRYESGLGNKRLQRFISSRMKRYRPQLLKRRKSKATNIVFFCATLSIQLNRLIVGRELETIHGARQLRIIGSPMGGSGNAAKNAFRRQG